MAKKSIAGAKAIKSKKPAVTPSAKRVVKPKQTQSTAPRKPAPTPKPTTAPRTKKTASSKPQKGGNKAAQYLVRGIVLNANGNPASNVIVRAHEPRN